jgi:hypothetical protein
MSSNDDFDDLSFPEITEDIFAIIQEHETPTPNQPNDFPEFNESKPNESSELENVLLLPHLNIQPHSEDYGGSTATQEEDRLEAALWDGYPELTKEDWARLDSDITSGSAGADSDRDMEDFTAKYRRFMSVTEISALI